jgi:hypothetical protein
MKQLLFLLGVCFHEPYWDENAMDLVEVLP